MVTIAMLLLAFLPTSVGQQQQQVGVVLLTAMWSEMEAFQKRLPLSSTISFPASAEKDKPFLLFNKSLGILGLVTGQGPRHASVSVMALALDPRFDTSESYFLFVGIAGVDPLRASVGSALWASHLVSQDRGVYLDDYRHNGWPTGFVPTQRESPFGMPLPTAREQEGILYVLPLASWAHERTKNLRIKDTARLARARLPYATFYPTAAEPPKVIIGGASTSGIYWVGRHATDVARNWSRYFSSLPEGSGLLGAFAMVAEEDTAVAEALQTLQRLGAANASRFMVLRTASDYTIEPPGQNQLEWFLSKEHIWVNEALESAYFIGSSVLLDLTEGGHRP